MARASSGKTALVEVKAVDDAYPLYGEVAVLEPADAGAAWRSPGVVLVERALLDRLGVEIGSPLTIGEASVTIGGVLGVQPDRLADRLAYGPKLLMSRETLARTGLLQPGSLIRWTYRVKLPEQRALGQAGAQGGAPRHRERIPAKRLRRPRLDRSRALAPPRRRPLHPIRQLRRADRAAARRHRRRQRHSELHGEEARDHRHLQMSRRAEPARARRLFPPGPAAVARRHRHRAGHRRAYARR